MNIEYQPEFDSIKSLLLEMAQERSVDRLLELIVNGMTARHHVGLTGIWLLKDSPDCSTCYYKKDCPQKEPCLQLAACKAYNHSKNQLSPTISHQLSKIPVGCHQIGKIADTCENIRITDIKDDELWGELLSWRHHEPFLGFAGQPLMYKNKVLGVLGVFPTIPNVKDGQVWLRIIADHAAIAITNAGAFEKIKRLKEKLELENVYLRDELLAVSNQSSIIGDSKMILDLMNQIQMVAPTDVSVLIQGESGTGKELIASEIHKRSRRADKPMIKVNCASIPKELYESEFFGHIKGAFTGAINDRSGRFLAADKGTLFLDEVGEIPLELQGKLLRVLQEGEFERIGEDKTRKVDIRVIAATNKNLGKALVNKEFREDLYYRLNVFPIKMGALKDRKKDIPLLSHHYLEKFKKAFSKTDIILTQKNMAELMAYDWPGNVRELKNVIQRSLIITNGKKLHLSLPDQLIHVKERSHTQHITKINTQSIETHDDFEVRKRNNIVDALRKTRGRIYGAKGAAVLLQLKGTTLAYQIKKYKVRASEYEL